MNSCSQPEKKREDQPTKTRNRDPSAKELREQEKIQKEVSTSSRMYPEESIDLYRLHIFIKAMKQLKAEMDSKVKSDPNNWGSHFRDRVLRALTMFGFGRWDRIKIESKCQNSDVKQIESFCRQGTSPSIYFMDLHITCLLFLL